MSLTLSQLRKRAVPVEIEISEPDAPKKELIKLEFNPRIYSPNYLSEVAGLPVDDNYSWARMLSKLVIKWDIVWGKEDAAEGRCADDQVGKPYPITFESLSELPLEVLIKIAAGIREKAQPEGNVGAPESGEHTGNGSSLAEEEGNVIANGESSTPPAISE